MKQINYIGLLIILFCFTYCKNSTPENIQSDEDFIAFLNDETLIKSIKRIDSIAKLNTYSNHKTGLLYFEKGQILGHLEKDIEAIASFKKALVAFEKESNKKYIAKTNMLLGDSEAFLSNNEKALQHIEKALSIFKDIEDKKGEAKALNSLGHIAFQYENYKKSIAYVKKAAEIQLQIDEKEELSASYNNIGYILEQSGDLINASEYYQKAIDLNKNINRLNSSPLRNLGYVFFMQNQFKKCDSLYLKALKIEEEAGRLSIQKEIYGVLLESAIKNKSFDAATLYITKRDSINERLVTSENKEKIKLIEDQYNLITKEKELIQAKKNNTKNKLIFTILAGTLLFLGLFLIQKHRNSKLKLEQEKLVLEQKVLRTQMNPHFIFNALTAIQKTIFDNDPIKSTSYLSRFAKLIRQNFEFVNKKEILLSEDLDALKNYIETQQLRFSNKFDYAINIHDGIDPTFVKIPPMLLQPFVENAIEHGLKPKTEKGTLEINITNNSNVFCFKIIDDGIGINNQESKTNREHAIDIFKKRLSLRKLGEEKQFSMTSNKVKTGTIVTFYLNLS
ncbi:tetratricopeptide repeat protein [Algibacter amylolyticus]|uniref:Tetratricopeptide repeat protein n=1 Tax=Algibacter amylolyticus TaxID=1608400 RepID=A0A5M7AV35_9FLAO|nr:tetratricopeptide repeat protein [Algibacter amylolyticus]KAA5821396.1 tetratricopeptide repeat protein [Algibacter amylolyticus]MBB5268265.1 tetratricopeptide (TPR) repeat protein [Algibacter amylolyticus]TSJ72908.1 tetratricopeptide repeat protein [Algibacter amylolyticus]